MFLRSHFARTLSRLSVGLAALAAGALSSGCASVVNGRSQWVEAESEKPGVLVVPEKHAPARPLPTEFQILRATDGQTLRFLYPRTDSAGGYDTVGVPMERALNFAVLANGLAGVYGLLGAGVDLATGALWRQDLALPGRTPRDLHIDPNPHPWNTGDWKGSVGTGFGFKTYPKGVLPEEITAAGDLALQLVLGRRAWPITAEMRLYVFSSLQNLDNHLLLELGPRKSWGEGALRPYLSGGVSLLERATLPGDGFPLGAWARTGLDIRFGSAGFVSPFIGYSKYEVVLSHGNTQGMTGGLQLGFLW